MALSFPNDSRCFDANRECVCFWGYDSTIEISFFLSMDALRCLAPDLDGGEAAVLSAFDVEREQILAVAKKKYARDARRAYAFVLVAKDFQYPAKAERQ